MAKLKQLTRKEKGTADALLADKTISGTDAVIAGGYDVSSRHSARQIAREVLNRPHVMAYLQDHAKEAEGTIVKTMRNRNNPRLAFDAAKDILDRVHGKATQKMETQSASVSINVDFSADAISVQATKPNAPLNESSE